MKVEDFRFRCGGSSESERKVRGINFTESYLLPEATGTTMPDWHAFTFTCENMRTPPMTRRRTRYIWLDAKPTTCRSGVHLQ